jgi:pilus assembly protein FimV
MLLRQLSTLVVILVGLFTSSYSLSLGLGEVTLRSSYNEPLVAEFQILQVQDLSRNDIEVSLASREDFSRIGIERGFFLTGLKFTVIFDDPGNAYVRVTTRKPVQEPYLNFLVNIQWPNGRLLREYTLLLDIPLYESGNADSVAAELNLTSPEILPALSDIKEQLSSQLTVVESKLVPAVTQVAKSNTPTTEVKVMPGDTLWDLARKMRPNQSLNVLQTMMAIQDVNPDAFIDGNINLLRTGAILRAPTLSEVEGKDYRKSAVAVKQQTDNWQQKDELEVVLSDESTAIDSTMEVISLEERSVPSSDSLTLVENFNQDGSDNVLQNELEIIQEELNEPLQEKVESSTVSPPLNSVIPQGRVTLGPSNFSSSSDSLKNLGQSGSNEALQNELAIAQKKLVQSLQENSNLKNRLLELEDSVRLTGSQLTVLEYQISALQGQISVDAPLAIENDDVVNNPVGVLDPLAKSEVNKGLETDNAAAGFGFSENDSLISQDTSSVTIGILYTIIIVLSLILIVFWLLVRSSEAEKNYDDSNNSFLPLEPNLESDGGHSVSEPLELSSEEGVFNLNDVEEKATNAVEKVSVNIGVNEKEKEKELLLIEIEKNPSNTEARLALLEVYVESQNSDAFNDQYIQLLQLGNQQVNDKALSLRDGLNTTSDVDDSNVEPEAETATLTEGELDDLLGDGFDDIIDDDDDDEAAPEDLSIEELLNKNLDLYFLDLNEDQESVDANLDNSLENKKNTSADLSLSNAKNILKTTVRQRPIIQDGKQDGRTESKKELGCENELDNIDSTSVELESYDVKSVELSNDVPFEFDFDLPPTDVDMASLDLELDEMSAMLDDDLVSAELEVDSEVEQKTEENLDEVSILAVEGQSHIGSDRVNDYPSDDLGEDDIGFQTREDQVETKLDLAQAYLDMGDLDGAEDILHEVIEEGDEEQKLSAGKLLACC